MAEKFNNVGLWDIALILSSLFLLSFAILVIANAILSDIEILQFINK